MLDAIYSIPFNYVDSSDVVTVENSTFRSPVIVTCDHASNYIPESLANLGLDPAHLQRHIAYDIGALALSHKISKKLDAALIYSHHSRLVIDLNRHLTDAGSIPVKSEDTVIPGNENLTSETLHGRAQRLFWPYHNKFSNVLDEFESKNICPLVLAVHTFTPVYHGFKRPWHTGVMWDTDDRIARPFMDNLNLRGDLVVGDNQPYTALDPLGYAFDVHARGRGLSNLFLEVRQDLVADTAGINLWASIVTDALLPLLENNKLFYK